MGDDIERDCLHSGAHEHLLAFMDLDRKARAAARALKQAQREYNGAAYNRDTYARNLHKSLGMRLRELGVHDPTGTSGGTSDADEPKGDR